MIPVDQEFLHDDNDDVVGDCVRASVASILNLPLSAVPHFVLQKHRAMMAMRHWLAERGLVVVEWKRKTRPLCYYLAEGWSPRELRHMVVMFGDELAHDPHPSRSGVDIDTVLLLVPIDIGEAMTHLDPEGPKVGSPADYFRRYVKDLRNES